MTSLRKMFHGASFGFTFIELLVVITIIGIVFASGIVSYSSITTRSRDARRKADLESIRQSLEMCRSLTGIYPTSIYEDDSSLSCGLSGPVLMKKTPLDPRLCISAGTDEYTFSRTSDTTYTLVAPCMEVDVSYQVTNP